MSELSERLTAGADAVEAVEVAASAVVAAAEAEPPESNVTVGFALCIGELAAALRKLDELRAVAS